MLNIFDALHLEWKKFNNNSVIQLFGLMFLLTFPTTIFVGKEFKDLPAPLPDNSIFFTFSGIWEYQAYIGSWLIFFFLAFIVMHMITSEVSHKTMRQNIISGMTRNQYFFGKVSVVFVFSILSTLFYTVVCLVIGYFHNDPYSFDFAFDDNLILHFFIMCLGFLSLALMIALLIRKSGIAIFTYISWVIFIEPFLKLALNYMFSVGSLVNFLPGNSFEDLTPFPPLKLTESFQRIGGFDYDLLLPVNHALIASVLYILIFLSISYWSFMKRDM